MPDTKDVISIRRATVNDVQIVSAITDTAYSKWVPIIGRKPEPMTVDYGEVIESCQVFLLAFGGSPVGVLVMKDEDCESLIWSVAVHPDFQGKGLGLRLLRFAEGEARARCIRELILYTNSLFVENLALYRWFGYVETRREPFRGSTIVYMSKKLVLG
jgi:GNAT superfamily N-acetyltransferase